jgi:polysaccharide export outer membrane protein
MHRTNRICYILFIAVALWAWPAAFPACAQESSPDLYRIQPEDNIEITVWPDENMSLKTTVRPDGTISYPFIGQLKVEGMTVPELSMRIEESLLGYLNDPKVAVNVTNFRRMRAFILGAVEKTGVYDIRKGDTVMDLITAAGGFTDKAKKSQVVLIRPPADLNRQSSLIQPNPDVTAQVPPQITEQEAMQHMAFINVAELLGEGEFPLQEAYMIQDGDIVFVPTGKRMDWQKLYTAVISLYYTFSIDSVIR